MAKFHVGCCITAHGFGHAARAMAVMESLAGLTDIQLTIATMVPEWFIKQSYSGSFTYVPVQTDIGIIQRTPLEQDIPATMKALTDFYPLQPETRRKLASVFGDCDIVVCDIAPAGILAAREAGVPSVLLENFTWDWIYEGYCRWFPELQKFIDYLHDVFLTADYRIQAEPLCLEKDCDLRVPPISRPFRMNRNQVREKLEIDERQKCVLISMGGISLAELPLEPLQHQKEVVFLVSGYTGTRAEDPNLLFLSNNSGLFHPDIVRSSDAVIGKVGYSTIAEVYQAGVPLGYVSREDFRESGPLVSFIEREMPGVEIDPQSFADGTWLDKLPYLFQLPPSRQTRSNGATECARFLQVLLSDTAKHM